MRIIARLPRSLPGRLVAGAACVFALVPLAGLAAPLDKSTCAKLAADFQNLKALDVDKLMENGPAWAASHLPPADLSLVRQYIDLDEQLKFRCSAPSSLVHLKHLEDEDEEGGQAKTAGTPGENDAKKAQSGDGEENASPPPQKQKATRGPAKEKTPRQQDTSR